MNSAIEGVADGGSLFVKDYGIDVVVDPDLEWQSSLPDEGFDFLFVSRSLDSKFVDRVLKIGGVIGMQWGNDISRGYQKQSDSRIVLYFNHCGNEETWFKQPSVGFFSKAKA